MHVIYLFVALWTLLLNKVMDLLSLGLIAHFSTLVQNVHTLHSGSCLSDHLPLCFLLQIQSLNSTPSPSPCLAKRLCIDWSKASPADLEIYCNMVPSNLPAFPSEVFSCLSTDCSCHHVILDTYAQHIVHTLHNCATHCVPSHITSSRRIVGWKDGAGVFKEASNFWHKVWVEAGCPSSGVLFSIKKNAKISYKYTNRRLMRRQQYMLQKKLAHSFSRKPKKNFWSSVKQLHKSFKSQLAPTVDGVHGCDKIANLFASKLKGTLNAYSPLTRDSLLS